MAKDRKIRYHSVQEVADALRACQDGKAPLVCACTGTKRLLFKIGRIVDNHGEVAIGGTLMRARSCSS